MYKVAASSERGYSMYLAPCKFEGFTVVCRDRLVLQYIHLQFLKGGAITQVGKERGSLFG
jgi:hypothetical protein